MTVLRGIPRAFVILLVIQAAYLYSGIATGDVPFGEDQDAYLAAAHEAREGGLWFDGQRHPLLPLVLAVAAPSGEGGFTASRLIVALGLGLMTLGQFMWARRLWGEGLGFLWAWALGFNNLVLSMGSMVMVEAWLVQLLGFTLLALVQAFLTQRGWWVAGLVLGLAYLAKGTVPVVAAAIFLPLCFGRSWRAATGMAAGFLPCVAMFCAYRQMAFGDPWYQVSQGISWLDYYHPHQLSGSGFSEEFTRIGWGGFFSRLASGVCQLPELIPAVVSPLRGGWTTLMLMSWVLIGIPFLRIHVQRGWHSCLPPRPQWVLAAILVSWGAALVLFCAWMVPVAKVPRYGAPLIPLTALALVHLWKVSKPRTARPGLPWRRSWIFVAMTALLLPWPAVSPGDLMHPNASWKRDERYLAYQQIRQAVEPSLGSQRPKILYGPGQVLPREWLWDYARVWLPYSAQDDPREVQRVFDVSDVWVLDRGTRERNGVHFQAACERASQAGILVLSMASPSGGVEVYLRR